MARVVIVKARSWTDFRIWRLCWRIYVGYFLWITCYLMGYQGAGRGE
uniref:Uncharacterized protein n=1 Tax=Arundo donax TaxID=35708 RepID=A0A0A9AQ47_ARUDO